MSREVLEKAFDISLTEGDVEHLETHGCDETTVALLAAAHAARCQALVRCTDPAFAARLFLIIAKRFAEDAQAAQMASLRNA